VAIDDGDDPGWQTGLLDIAPAWWGPIELGTEPIVAAVRICAAGLGRGKTNVGAGFVACFIGVDVFGHALRGGWVLGAVGGGIACRSIGATGIIGGGPRIADVGLNRRCVSTGASFTTATARRAAAATQVNTFIRWRAVASGLTFLELEQALPALTLSGFGAICV
jgi:hypothetical protein